MLAFCRPINNVCCIVGLNCGENAILCLIFAEERSLHEKTKQYIIDFKHKKTLEIQGFKEF
jgi:hypothetical protein